MVINGIIDLDNGELLEATGKHRISALDIQGSETAELKLTFYKNGSAVTDNSVVSGAVIDFGVKADADYTGTSYLIYHDTFSASTDGLTYSGTPTWATAEVETALGNESSVKLHGQVKVVISGVTYYSQVFEVEIHNNVIQAAGTTNSVIYPRLIQSTSDPTVNDDSLDGYGVSSLWLNTSSNAVHVLMDNTAGAAVWAGFLGLTNGQLANNLVFNDNLKAVFGTSSDGLEIYHNGSNSYISDTGTGDLIIQGSDDIWFRTQGGNNYANFNSNGSVDLYYSNSKKFETTDTGATVTGKLIVSGDLDVDGTTTTFNSTVVTVDDPVFGIGGDTAPGSQDNKDRGVSFRYHDGASAKVGFFGWDNSEDSFVFLTDTNDDSTEVFSGTLADLKCGKVLLEDGSASAPSLTFSNDSDLGIYRASSDTLVFSAQGNERFRVSVFGVETSYQVKSKNGTAASPSFAFQGDSTTGIFRADSDSIGFTCNGTEAARFDSSGHFLIPDGNKIKLGDDEDLQVYHLSGNNYISAITGGNLFIQGNTVSLRSVSQENLITAMANGAVSLFYDAVKTFETISGGCQITGNLGIGVTPSEKLTVDGHIRVGNGTNIFLWNDNNNNYLNYANWVASTGSQLTVQNNGSGGIHLKANGTNADVIFSAKDGTTLNELMRLDGSASSINVPDNIIFKVGTGALSLFHNDNNETWNYYSSASGTAIFSHAANDQDFVFQTTSGGTTSEVLRLDGSTGNVGIGGVTAPDFALDVGGDIGINDKIYHNGDHNTYIGFTGSDTISFRTGGTDVITLDSSQRCGIGTTSPSAKLDIYAAPNTNSLFLRDSSDSEYTHNFYVDSAGNGHTIMYAEGNAAKIAFSTSGDSYFNSGNVGIGTTAPVSTLEIKKGNTNVWSALSDVDDKSALRIQPISDSSSSFWFGGFTGGARGIQIANGDGTGSYNLILNPFGGNVGIGTTSPQTPMHLEFSGNNGLRIRSTSGDAYLYLSSANTTDKNNIIYFGDNDTSTIGAIQYDHNNDLMQFKTNGSNRLTLNSSGDAEILTDGKGLILSSPDGTRYKITVANDGTVTSSAA